jgi:hypothetical protein
VDADLGLLEAASIGLGPFGLGAPSGYVFCALADVYPSEDWNRASILCDGSGPESSEWCREYRLMLGRPWKKIE